MQIHILVYKVCVGGYGNRFLFVKVRWKKESHEMEKNLKKDEGPTDIFTALLLRQFAVWLEWDQKIIFLSQCIT